MGRNGFAKKRRKKVTTEEDESFGMQTNDFFLEVHLTQFLFVKIHYLLQKISNYHTFSCVLDAPTVV
jgi:hypothetical protein